MRMHPFPMTVAIVLVLAACRPAATEWTESEAPNRDALSSFQSLNVSFSKLKMAFGFMRTTPF